MADEDFTSFTEFDEGADVTVDSATKVSWVALHSRGDTAYLYKDKGADHFSGDFTHKFECQYSAANNNPTPAHWMISNIIGDMYDIYDQSEDGHSFALVNLTLDLRLYIWEGGSNIQDTWTGSSASTNYFIEIVRDDDGGANSTGRLTAYIRIGSHSGALQDTLVVDASAGQQNDFRYLYALATYDYGITIPYSTGYTQNLDIGEAPAGWTGKIAGITNPAKINGVEVANIASVVGQ